MNARARRPDPIGTALTLMVGVGLTLASATAPTLAAPATTPPATTAPDSPVPVTRPQRLISIGFMAGEPTGGTFKMISPKHSTHAWEMGLGWSMAGEDGLQFHAQHQWHLATLTRSSNGESTFYFGAGGRVKQVEGTRIGLRAALGLNWVAGSRPRSWEAFLEVAPTLDLTPDNDTWVNAMIGMRWYVHGGTGR